VGGGIGRTQLDDGLTAGVAVGLVVVAGVRRLVAAEVVLVLGEVTLGIEAGDALATGVVKGVGVLVLGLTPCPAMLPFKAARLSMWRLGLVVALA